MTTNKESEMNRKEHLLTCLTEECSEVIKAVSKAQRFGLLDGYPDSGTTNEQDIQEEFAQAVAVMEMLEEEVFRKRDINRLMRVANIKKAKVNEWMEYAKAQGTLT